MAALEHPEHADPDPVMPGEELPAEPYYDHPDCPAHVETVRAWPHDLHRAVGPWRRSQAAAQADLVLVFDAGMDRTVEALREVLFLAGEAVADDPSTAERAAILKVEALATLLGVASEQP